MTALELAKTVNDYRNAERAYERAPSKAREHERDRKQKELDRTVAEILRQPVMFGD